MQWLQGAQERESKLAKVVPELIQIPESWLVFQRGKQSIKSLSLQSLEIGNADAPVASAENVG